jgi:hypothetical protein
MAERGRSRMPIRRENARPPSVAQELSVMCLTCCAIARAIYLWTRDQSQYFVSVFHLPSRCIERGRRASNRYQQIVQMEVMRCARKSHICEKLRL